MVKRRELPRCKRLEETRMTPYAEVAVQFASALVDGDFARAEALLTPDYRRQLPANALREKFQAMCSYGTGPARKLYFDEQFQMTEWRTKIPGDVGWAYV